MKALILVDIQNDFCPGGALAVPDGDAVVAVANRVMGKFPLVVATQDFHPRSHESFAANHPGHDTYDVIDLEGLPQVLWPVHCVAGSPGAEFHPQLEAAKLDAVFPKGTDPSIDSYSGFFDNGHRKSTGLGDYLRAKQVDEVFVMGLATDYCVKATALDAVELGFRTTLIEDGCRGVGLAPGDIDAAKLELRDAGVAFCQSGSLI
ncbi:MAG TPA: bifunctional nicotinamidase/pyrazinamidase [Polyangiales bacterium]|nr:bifunctional nicotinamidase/pyrazinamidase [Polyangiales bacterium]